MKSKKVVVLLILALLVFAAAPLAEAQSKPNVSGTWKMNAAKSKFEKGGPQNIIIKFDQQGTTLSEALTLTNEGSDRTITFTYTLDGKESAQQLEGQEIKTTAKWEGEALIIEFKNGEGFNFLRKFAVAADGKSMTINVMQTNPNGSVNDIVVLDKQ
jgi:hypothetical protein